MTPSPIGRVADVWTVAMAATMNTGSMYSGRLRDNHASQWGAKRMIEQGEVVNIKSQG